MASVFAMKDIQAQHANSALLVFIHLTRMNRNHCAANVTSPAKMCALRQDQKAV